MFINAYSLHDNVTVVLFCVLLYNLTHESVKLEVINSISLLESSVCMKYGVSSISEKETESEQL